LKKRRDGKNVRILKQPRGTARSRAQGYDKTRRPPATLLIASTDSRLGDESELFRDLDRR
jgi:hypothetical protein